MLTITLRSPLQRLLNSHLQPNAQVVYRPWLQLYALLMCLQSGFCLLQTTFSGCAELDCNITHFWLNQNKILHDQSFALHHVWLLVSGVS